MLMKKKNLIRHYFMLMAMLFVVSGSFVSNVMAADTDFEVICSGNTVKLVSISQDDNDNSISSPFTDCVFCHLVKMKTFITHPFFHKHSQVNLMY